ncbi:MAG: TfoX/Sxy family protein [Ignavibacteriaceae bacterium]
MAYSEELAIRVRAILVDHPKVEEKKMMGGLTFMVNNKMCVGILQDDLMARINPDDYETALERSGCREMPACRLPAGRQGRRGFYRQTNERICVY